MMCAATAAMIGGAKISAKSYVQDGLVAMWDGIENAGWGKHDPNATVWKDLTGDGYDATMVDGIFLDDCASLTGSTNAKSLATLMKDIPVEKDWTFQICFDWKLYTISGAGYRGLFSPRSDNRAYSLNIYYNRYVENSGTLSGYDLVGSNPTIGVGIGKLSLSLVWNHDLWGRYEGTNAFRRVIKDGNVVVGSRGTGNYSDSLPFDRGIGLAHHYGPNAYFYNLRVYSRDLTNEEIIKNYAIDKARFKLPDAT